MKTRLSKPLALATAIAGIVLLPACSSDVETADADLATKDDTTQTVAALLSDLPELSKLNSAMSAAQLGSVFDGPASYTLLAPNDAAFDALGDRGNVLTSEEQRPVLVALLRNHMLPGHLTPENITDAIKSQGGTVSMTTLGGGTVTFSMDKDSLVISNGDGSTARLAGSASAATNGVIIPMDAVLIPEAAPGA